MILIEIDKIGSATSPLNLAKTIAVVAENLNPKAGDVVVVRALSESVTYGNLELPSGRLAKVNKGDILVGVLGKRRALKGFVGDVPESVKSGDRLHLLNMGGVIGICSGHHSSLSDAIEVEVMGIAMSVPSAATNGSTDESQPREPHSEILNIGSVALPSSSRLNPSAPIVFVAGTCMNSGKTVAAAEIIKQAHHHGLKVAGAKISGVACLRDTLNMQDHGAFLTASFLDCGLPSTVDAEDLPCVAKSIFNHLNTFEPDFIIAELGDGVIGGYSVDTVLCDEEIKDAISSFVFCASDYVGVIGGAEVLKSMGIAIDVVAGSVTDSQMGEDFIEAKLNLRAGNARRNGAKLFSMIESSIQSKTSLVAA